HICTGGAEIQSHANIGAADNAPGNATIPDANAPMLRALSKAAGIEVVGHVSTNDDPSALAAALSAGVEQLQPDVVVTSGGISAGKFEVVRQVLEGVDSQAWFGHVDQQPGGPQGYAILHGVQVICVPVNPVSTFVNFRYFFVCYL